MNPIMQSFSDELLKLAVGDKTLLRGAIAAFRRAGHAVDPSKIRWHGLEELNPHSKSLVGYSRTEQVAQRENARYRLNAYQTLFPKGSPLPREEAIHRFEAAANVSVNNGFGPFDKEGPKLRKAIEERAKAKGRPIRNIKHEGYAQQELEG